MAFENPQDEIANVDAKSREREGAPAGQPELEALIRTVWRLRQPDGCPWDREQTHASISRNMLEEAYEAVDAIEEGSAEYLREELGDVLLQVLLHAQISADEGGYGIADIAGALNEKLIRRHPHVFADVEAGNAEEALASWDSVKRVEREGRDEESEEAPEGLLDSIPISFPALMQAQKVSVRAAKAGFEWETTEDVWAKFDEERAEFAAEEQGSEEALEEFGDLLFTLVNVARREGVDAEAALRSATRKFRARWAAIERAAREKGATPDELDMDELEELWGRAKEL